MITSCLTLAASRDEDWVCTVKSCQDLGLQELQQSPKIAKRVVLDGRDRKVG